MRLRRRTAARIISEAQAAGRSLTTEEVKYLSNLDPQDVKAGREARTLAVTGAAYLASRQAVGLGWNATGRELAEARKAQGVVVGKGKVSPAPFTADDIPSPEGKTKGEYMAACKAFAKQFGVKVSEARKRVPVAATNTLDLSTLTKAQQEALTKALKGILDPS